MSTAACKSLIVDHPALDHHLLCPSRCTLLSKTSFWSTFYRKPWRIQTRSETNACTPRLATACFRCVVFLQVGSNKHDKGAHQITPCCYADKQHTFEVCCGRHVSLVRFCARHPNAPCHASPQTRTSHWSQSCRSGYSSCVYTAPFFKPLL